ncbi:MAG: hypothetical protein H6833_07085 [Planctomycetes bacterium]|nr:hypothetical protein [Planctomycetota bacterium]
MTSLARTIASLALFCAPSGTSFAQDVRFSPFEEPEPDLREKTGFLVVRTVPQTCTVRCDVWNVTGYEKTDERVNVLHVPPGEASIVLVAGEVTFEHALTTEAGVERHLTFDLAARRVYEDVGDLVVQASEAFHVTVDDAPRSDSANANGELLVPCLKAGDHRVTLQRLGYEPIVTTVTIERSRRTDLWPDTSESKPTYWSGSAVPGDEAFRQATWRIGVRARGEDVRVTCSALSLESVLVTSGFEIAGVHADFFGLAFQQGERTLTHDLFPSVGEVVALSLDFDEGRVHTNTGDVTLQGAENVQLHLNGEPWRTEERDGRLCAYDLEPGTYTLRVERAAHHPSETAFEVQAGRVTALTLEPLHPILAWLQGEDRPSPEQIQTTAGLYLAGLAGGERIRCEALGLDRTAERAGALRVYGLPAGRHAFAVDEVTFETAFQPGRRVRLQKTGNAFTPLPPTPEDYRLVGTVGRFERDPAVALAVHPEGRFVVAASRERHLSVFDLLGMRATARFASEWPLIDVVFCDEGRRLAALHRNDRVAVFDRSRGRTVREVETGGPIGYAVHALKDANTFVTVAWDNRVTHVRFLGIDGTEHGGFTVKERLEHSAVHPHGTWLAASAGGSEVLVFDTSTGERIERLTRHRRSVTALAFRPDGERLATASDDETIRIWDVARWKTKHVLRGPRLAPEALAFSPDGRWLAAVGDDCFIWDAETGAIVTVLPTSESQTTAIAFLPDGSGCVTAGRAKTLQVWRVDGEVER